MSVAEIDTLADGLRSLLDVARRSGEPIQIVDHGEIVAHIVPNPPRGAVSMTVDQFARRLGRTTDDSRDEVGRLDRTHGPYPDADASAARAARRARTEAILADMDRLAVEISKVWPEGVSAIDAVRDVRREL